MDQNSSQNPEPHWIIRTIEAGAAERATEFKSQGYNGPHWTTSTSAWTSDGSKEFEVLFPRGRSFEECVLKHDIKNLHRYTNTALLRVGYLKRSGQCYLVVYNPNPPTTNRPTRRKDRLSLEYGLLWGALRAYRAQLKAENKDIRIDDFCRGYFDELWGNSFDERLDFEQRCIRDYEERKKA